MKELNCALSFLSVAGIAFRASGVKGGKVQRVHSVFAHGGARPTGVTIGSLNDAFMFGMDG